MVRNYNRTDVMSCWKKPVNILDSCKYYILPAVVCGTCIIEPGTFDAFEDYFGVFGGGTCLAMPKTICAPDTSSLKPSSGATEGVLD